MSLHNKNMGNNWNQSATHNLFMGHIHIILKNNIIMMLRARGLDSGTFSDPVTILRSVRVVQLRPVDMESFIPLGIRSISQLPTRWQLMLAVVCSTSAISSERSRKTLALYYHGHFVQTFQICSCYLRAVSDQQSRCLTPFMTLWGRGRGVTRKVCRCPLRSKGGVTL